VVEVTDLPGVTRICGVSELLELAAQRDDNGFGHLEIARPPDLYPMLSVFLRGQDAAVLRIDEEGGPVMFAAGDGTIDATMSIEFLGPVGLETFTGEVVLNSRRATELIASFAKGEGWPVGTRWSES